MMKVKKNKKGLFISCQTTPQYYRFISFWCPIMKYIVLLLLPICMSIGIFSQDNPVHFLFLPLIFFPNILIIKRTLRIIRYHNIYELTICDESVEIVYIYQNKRPQTITIPKKEVRILFEIIYKRHGYRYIITLETSNSNEYEIVNFFSLWTNEEMGKIFEYFKKYNYPTKKIDWTAR